MSDTESSTTVEKPFVIEKAKTGRAACKKCKDKCAVGELRMGKTMASAFGSGTMNNWYHVDCLLASFKTQRASTKSLESVDEVAGWDQIGDLERDDLLEKFSKVASFNKTQPTNNGVQPIAIKTNDSTSYKAGSEDNLFSTFQRICNQVSSESSYLGKSAILNKFFKKGCNGKRFEGNMFVWVKMLLPNSTTDKRVYNLQSRQLIKLFSRIFGVDVGDMMTDLEQGDVSETIRKFFMNSKTTVKPARKSSLTLDEVDAFLSRLVKLSKEDEQTEAFRKVCQTATADDIKMIVRFIKHDIRINSGAKHVLEAINKDAYSTYQSCQNLQEVVAKYGPLIGQCVIEPGVKAVKSSAAVQLMSPISPMLAEACKSVERAIEKCPDGMYSEIKYDGERIQLHKRGDEFRFFSRNLKAVPDHKTRRCEEFVPKAFPTASDIILDSEILMVDTQTGEQLPFGTLGKHKKTAFDTAEVCLFVFDCIYLNGEDLTKKPLKERRRILEEIMTPIKNHVQLSEYHVIRKPRELSVMIAKVLQLGLEGLVLKNVNGVYEPGKRHWLKVKKDYLFDGQMADSADLVVLGAWFGKGKNGGILSIFLMGCFDEKSRRWKTVTKVHTGLDDKTMGRMHKKLTALMTRGDSDNPPAWLHCKKSLIPDMIAVDPQRMPVWEITGAEFSRSESHTADGISIRFPRITKQRDDKTHREATSLTDLNRLFQASKEGTNIQMLTSGLDSDDADDVIEIKTKIQGAHVSPPNKRGAKALTEVNDETKVNVETKKVKSDSVASDNTNLSVKIEADNVDEEIFSPVSKRKVKINYKFEDSSDDDEDMADVTVASKNVVTKKSVEPKVDKSSASTIDPSPTKLIMSDIKSIPPTLESRADKSIAKKEETTTSMNNNEFAKPKATGNSSINIFEGVVLFVDKELRERVKEELRYFKLWGGQETKSLRQCSHVLHAGPQIAEPWSIVRTRYAHRTRHVQFGWLVDSVRDKSLAAIEAYPVQLGNSS